MDPLTPVYIRLKKSTVDALRVAKSRSSHRTMASFVDDLLRQKLGVDTPAPDARFDALNKAAQQIKSF